MEQKNSPSNKPKFNAYWFYAIIAVILISLNLFSLTGSTPDVSMTELTKLIQKGDVKRIVIVSSGEQSRYADIYIDKDKLIEEAYEEVAKSTIGTANPGPHYKHTIIVVENFMEKVEEVQKVEEKDDSAK